MGAFQDIDIRLVIPALDEEETIADVVLAAPAFFREVIVVDNGSIDDTAGKARAAGAHVVSEPCRGYGRACKTGVAAAGRCDIIVFMDADGADVPDEAWRLVEPIIADKADFVVGSRRRGRVEPGALTLPQRIGNALACALMRLFWRGRFTDLGPFRAIRRDALDRLSMDDEAYGWTAEMQARALKLKLRCAERPVDYRRRKGRSKISGTVKGVVKAGSAILYVLIRERLTKEQTFARLPEGTERRSQRDAADRRMVASRNSQGATARSPQQTTRAGRRSEPAGAERRSP